MKNETAIMMIALNQHDLKDDNFKLILVSMGQEKPSIRQAVKKNHQ